jgi:hypothetical protein
MKHPPFPPLNQLTHLQLLFLPEDPAEIRRHIKIWQEKSRQLSAWIEKAKQRSAKVPQCSWNWPATPFIPFSVKDDSSSISTDDRQRSNHCELDKMFVNGESHCKL